nr:hypothetical protein [Tanacetum cinerariifolium]
MQMIGGNGGNQFRQYAGQNAGNPNGYNAVHNVRNQVAQNPRVQNVGNQNGLIGVQGNGIQNQIGNGNFVAARAEGNAAGHNGNQIRCYNCRGEEVGIQLQAEEYDLIAAAANHDEIEEVNANCILMANLQQASSLGTQTDSTPVYDSDGSAEISDLNKQLSKEKSTVSFLLEEKKKLKSDFKTCEDELLDKQIKLEKKIKELNNIVLKMGKSTIVTLQRVVKQRMTIETHNWASSGHQEFHKIVREENVPIVNQVDARMQNFEIQFLKEATKFVGDFKSLAKEADASLAKLKILELEIKRLLKAVVSQDIISVVQNASVVDISDLQTELERTKECFENCIIKKETEYAKLWNDWYKRCNECKYDKISYNKAYKDMQQKIEQLQAQLGVLKRKSKDISCVSNTLHSLSQKLENENVELEFQVIAPGMFRISPDKVSREAQKVPNTDVISKVICAKCKKCLISINHDVCLNNYVNGKKSRGRKHKSNVLTNETQQKNQPEIKKPKK